MVPGIRNRGKHFVIHLDPFRLLKFPAGRRQKSGPPRIRFQPGAVKDLSNKPGLSERLLNETDSLDKILSAGVPVFGLLEQTDFLDFGVGSGSDHGEEGFRIQVSGLRVENNRLLSLKIANCKMQILGNVPFF
jgi:hypothetical protein